MRRSGARVPVHLEHQAWPGEQLRTSKIPTALLTSPGVCVSVCVRGRHSERVKVRGWGSPQRWCWRWWRGVWGPRWPPPWWPSGREAATEEEEELEWTKVTSGLDNSGSTDSRSGLAEPLLFWSGWAGLPGSDRPAGGGGGWEAAPKLHGAEEEVSCYCCSWVDAASELTVSPNMRKQLESNMSWKHIQFPASTQSVRPLSLHHKTFQHSL